MEIKSKNQIYNSFSSLKRKIFFVALLLNILLLAIVISILIYSNSLLIKSSTFWIAFIVIILVGNIITYVIFRLTIKPLSAVLSALAYVKQEPFSTTPPNPNKNSYYGKDIQSAIQGIYELSAGNQMNNMKNDDTFSLDDALDVSDCGIVILDQAKNIIYHNQAAPVQVGIKDNLVLNITFNDNDSFDDWLNKVRVTSVHADHYWNRLNSVVNNDNDNRRIFDVYASYEKESRYEVALIFIDKTADYKQEDDSLNFIAFAAHELRGPLTVIRGYIEILEDELNSQINDEQKGLLKRLEISASRLSDYINNILNTSKYDQRHLKLHLRENSIANVFNSIADDLKLRASAQGRLLAIQIPDNLPTVAVDMASISEVFNNLIENAIKYSYDGGVINVSAKADGNFVEISVQDHGIGMPGNVVGSLFQKFYRSHRSSNAVAGMGLGLYISKAIVESHGGTISVRSHEGEGSTFTISLPTFASIADKIVKSDNENLIEDEGRGWIKNHSMYRG